MYMGRQRPREAQGQPAGRTGIKLPEAWLFSQSPFLTHSAIPAPMCKSRPRLASFVGALLPYLGTMGRFTGVVTFSSPKINSDGILGPQVPDSESILIEMKVWWEVQKKSKAYCGVFLSAGSQWKASRSPGLEDVHTRTLVGSA